MSSPGVPVAHSLLGLLLRVRVRCIRNGFMKAVDEAPLRLSLTVLLIAVIWFALHRMFLLVFDQLERTPLQASIAIPLIFNFFFVAMLVLLAFSNAIIVYGSLFGKNESSYLLAAPLAPHDVVSLKYLESVIAASWALVLLGIPLMLAMAELTNDALFYVLFLAFFLAFIPIPAALGLLLAWFTARFFPRRVLQTVVVIGGLLVFFFLFFGIRTMQFGETPIEIWLRGFQERMRFLQAPFLPNYWVSTGIDHALNGHFDEALLYLGVTVSNAAFLSWLAVRVSARHLFSALDRAVSGGSGARRSAVDAAAGAAGRVFFYMPRPLRLIAAKDLRTFFRDPLQWSQLVILFALLGLYMTNMPTLRAQLSGYGWYLLIPFLNLCTVSLILATFTCRFVFPLVSLEGHQLWLIGLLPFPRGQVLYAKMAFALTVTLFVGMAAMIPAIFLLQVTAEWAVLHLAVTFGICFGLCGFSVGLGARLPMFGETNAARIANGMGGTVNLLASLALAGGVLAGVGVATWRYRDLLEDTPPDWRTNAFVLGISGAAVAAGLAALWVGMRHFRRVEI